jgi:hypothetical protein
MLAVSRSEPAEEAAEVPGALKQLMNNSAERKRRTAEAVLASRDCM